jgi:2-polyprenyl-3-methyl-5-hydroxy-6-metoxy-1,4-benzoquinol methylase
LARNLTGQKNLNLEPGIDAFGIDAIPEFIEIANKQKTGRFKVLSYEKSSSDELKEKFDVAVCNFSLLGEKSVNSLFRQIPSLLNETGVFIVQTVHPVVGCGNYK